MHGTNAVCCVELMPPVGRKSSMHRNRREWPTKSSARQSLPQKPLLPNKRPCISDYLKPVSPSPVCCRRPSWVKRRHYVLTAILSAPHRTAVEINKRYSLGFIRLYKYELIVRQPTGPMITVCASRCHTGQLSPRGRMSRFREYLPINTQWPYGPEGSTALKGMLIALSKSRVSGSQLHFLTKQTYFYFHQHSIVSARERLRSRTDAYNALWLSFASPKRRVHGA
jgi:hypothetical protein